MVWFIEGLPDDIAFHVNKDGRSLSGTARSHKPSQRGDESDRDMDRRFEFDRFFFDEIQAMPLHWSIDERDAQDRSKIYWGKALSEQLEKCPDKAIGAVSMLAESNLLGSGIFLPRAMFESIWKLCLSARNTRGAIYLITLDFVGFPFKNIESSLPSIASFRAGESYVTDFSGFTLKPKSAA